MAAPSLIFLAGMALGMALTLITLGLWIIATGEPVDDSTDDDADFDPRIADLGRRVGNLPPFHETEL